MIRYIHGSSDSVDLDTVYVFENEPTFKEAKEFCDNKKDENANIICIDNGKVSYCYKGTIDEINNSILATYGLHRQDYPLIITDKVERDKYLKLIRSTRCITSQFSRTDIRTIIKKGLNGNWSDRKKALLAVEYKLILFNLRPLMYGKKNSTEILKSIAFQIGQTLALFVNNEELYTKNDVSEKYPLLRQYLERYPTDTVDIRTMLRRLINVLQTEKYKIIGEHGVQFESNSSVVYDMKTEQKKVINKN